MPQPLVIVESPAKAKTIAGYLGDEYMVESSIGHIRDLPSKASEIPAAYKREKWANMLFRRLVEGPFAGRLAAVNPARSEIEGQRL